jgi:ParB family chromosome partitioning protein
MADKRPALGRGLSALIPDAPAPAARDAPIELDIDRLSPNTYQPRGAVEETNLDELAASIKANGVIQPIVVRRQGDRFEIIAGERRWRAAQRAGLLRVPVVVRDIPQEKLLEVALIENIQRENLNPIEEANAYRRLIDEFGLKQEEVAAAVGKDRSSVANFLRLLRLPDEVRADLAGGSLSMGHARALLALADEAAQRAAARDVIARSLSVRETEGMVKKLLAPKPDAGPGREPTAADVHVRAAEEQLRLALGTRARIVRRGKGGRIEIDFTSDDELQRIYEYLTDRR